MSQTETQKATQRRYEQSKAGKTAAQRYRKSEKGKVARKRYWQSEKSKTAQRRYYQTIRGCLMYRFVGIKQRCNNPKYKGYKNYGGRGIRCLFKSSDEFVNYIINELQIDPRKLTIDRIDNDGNYERGNIRFVTQTENLKNRRKKAG